MSFPRYTTSDSVHMYISFPLFTHSQHNPNNRETHKHINTIPITSYHITSHQLPHVFRPIKPNELLTAIRKEKELSLESAPSQKIPNLDCICLGDSTTHHHHHSHHHHHHHHSVWYYKVIGINKIPRISLSRTSLTSTLPPLPSHHSY